jgi:hypothetical protein
MNKDLFTSEVATRFGVDARSVRAWCARRLLPGAYEEETPRGSVWRIPEIALDGFVPPKIGRPRTRKVIDEATMAEKAA